VDVIVEVCADTIVAAAAAAAATIAAILASVVTRCPRCYYTIAVEIAAVVVVVLTPSMLRQVALITVTDVRASQLGP